MNKELDDRDARVHLKMGEEEEEEEEKEEG